MNLKRLALAATLGLSTVTWAQAAPAPAAPPAPCEKTLPALRPALSFKPGEHLEFTLDAMGAQAGTMTMAVQRPDAKGLLPVQVEVHTNSFFSKVRRVKGKVTSYLHPKTLRPERYFEDVVENEVPRKVDVLFGAKTRTVKVDSVIKGRANTYDLHWDKDVLDVAGALYAVRQLPLKEGLPLCVDVYGIRRMWRLTGSVLARERVTLPMGQFDAWHLSGVAVRLDKPSMRREVHVWLSDDARRLPLAAVGTIDLGTVRATLTRITRPGEKPLETQGKEDLKW